MATYPDPTRRIQSLLSEAGRIEVSLCSETLSAPADDEVVIAVEAAPINPSDLGLLFGPAELSSLTRCGSEAEPCVCAPVSGGALKVMAARVGKPQPVGNEGAGRVVAAGAAPAAQALLGRTVASVAGGMYCTHRLVKAAQCVALPEGVTAAQGAAMFVNPLTALGMVDTMRRGGHSALVHTAAASNLGQMLNRLCLADGIGLVNVVRSEAQETLLRDQGAIHVCNSSHPDFAAQLTEQIAATGATVAFDAIGGGSLGSQILASMEAALLKQCSSYSRYGSTTHKQLYIYGALDPAPTVFKRNCGFAFGITGWLLMPYLESIGMEAVRALQQRVIAGLGTTFASRYAREISLLDMLDPDLIAIYAARSTGAKFLLTPQL